MVYRYIYRAWILGVRVSWIGSAPIRVVLLGAANWKAVKSSAGCGTAAAAAGGDAGMLSPATGAAAALPSPPPSKPASGLEPGSAPASTSDMTTASVALLASSARSEAEGEAAEGSGCVGAAALGETPSPLSLRCMRGSMSSTATCTQRGWISCTARHSLCSENGVVAYQALTTFHGLRHRAGSCAQVFTAWISDLLQL